MPIEHELPQAIGLRRLPANQLVAQGDQERVVSAPRLPNVPQPWTRYLQKHNLIGSFTARLVTAAEAAGTPWAIENPADRGDESSPAYWRIHRDHAADIIVAASGVPGIVTPDMVRPGAAVLDVGITRTDHGLVGDVDPAVAEVAGFLAPMPGGVGPMTRAMLMANVVAAAERAA